MEESGPLLQVLLRLLWIRRTQGGGGAAWRLCGGGAPKLIQQGRLEPGIPLRHQALG